MDSNILEYVGKSLYQTQFIKEMKRYVVFRFRCATHGNYIRDLLGFFDQDEYRRSLLKGNPSFLEQITRSFFYKGSSWAERVKIVKDHVEILEANFDKKLLERLYINHDQFVLWEDSYQEKPLTMSLWFHAGQRKEGCLSLTMMYDKENLYQIMFWLAKDNDDTPTIYIGALQGPQNGSELIKGLTKAFFGYRTKNLIFYGLRSFAKVIGANKIYAVGNDGYYAMNHLRADRKLKTDFGAFWEECEGVRCEDKRFYVIPVDEHRKSMEELKPSKRAQHRKRFAKMDEMETAVTESLSKFRL